MRQFGYSLPRVEDLKIPSKPKTAAFKSYAERQSVPADQRLPPSSAAAAASNLRQQAQARIGARQVSEKDSVPEERKFVSGANVPGYTPLVVKNRAGQNTPSKATPSARESQPRKPAVPLQIVREEAKKEKTPEVNLHWKRGGADRRDQQPPEDAKK